MRRRWKMAQRIEKQSWTVEVEPSQALNAVCPYYTMFPLAFPISVLKRGGKPRLRVLRPFCGQGTTIFAARLDGHRAYGIDRSPIAPATRRNRCRNYVAS